MAVVIKATLAKETEHILKFFYFSIQQLALKFSAVGPGQMADNWALVIFYVIECSSVVWCAILNNGGSQ